MDTNLALITQDFPPDIGGIETYATELAKRFAQQYNHFFVMAPDKSEAFRVDSKLSYEVERIKASNPFLGLKGFYQAPLMFSKHSVCNAFHAQWQTLPISVFARLCGQVNRIHVAVHARELLFNPFRRIPGLMQAYEVYKRWMLAQVDMFFPVSTYTAGLLHNHGINENRIKVVINGTDPDTFYPKNTEHAREALGINAENVLLTITRLVSRKGVDTALKAFKKVLSTHPDSCYVVVGEGAESENLKQMTANLGIDGAVKFVGRVPYHTLIDYYNACNIFAMPSKTEIPNVEGFGIVFLEANACSKPVIGSCSGGIPSAIIDGKTGLLVQERNVDALAKAIQRLFTHPRQARQLGENGRKRVLQKANWDATARKLINAMENNT